MNILDKRATNPAAALDGTELVYVAQLGDDAVTTVQDIKDFANDTVYIPNSTDPFPLTTKTLYMIGDFITTTYGDLYLQLPPLTTSTIIEIQLAYNIEAVGHVYLIPSGTDLVFGQGTPVDLKSLPLAPGCTVKLFFHSVGVGWIGQANYSNHFVDLLIHPFNATSWTSVGHSIVSESTGVCNLTIPDGSINLGDLSFIATTSGNVLSGDRTRILGGSSNTVSGTDNVAIECTGLILNDDVPCSNIVAVGVHNTLNQVGLWPFPKSTVVLGSSTSTNTPIVDSPFGAALGGVTCLYTGMVAVSATVTDITASGGVAASNSNSLKAVAGTTGHGAAVHDIEFMIAVGTDSGFGSVMTRRTVFERRKVYVCRDQSGTMTSSTITPETAVTLGDAATGTVTVGVTVDTTNNRIVPTVTGVSGTNQTHYQASVRVTSHYNRK